MKQRLLQLLLNPIVISGLLTVVIIYFLPDYFSKYKLNLIFQEYNGDDKIYYFQDLNNDGDSEKIACYTNIDGNASYMIYDVNDNLIDQWNFNSKFLDNHKYIWFVDSNENNQKEICLITQAKDSLFLNIVEPFGKNSFKKNNIFIDVLPKSIKDYKVRQGHEIKNKSIETHTKDIVFTLNSGFVADFRYAYKYDFKTDIFLKSPHLTNTSLITHSLDLDSDYKNEYILRNSAYGNKIDSTLSKKSDYSSWLMVLDDDLSFMFEPIEFSKKFSSLRCIPFKDKEYHKLFCVFKSKNSNEDPSELFITTVNGKIINKKHLPKGKYTVPALKQQNEFVLLNGNTGIISSFSKDLKEISSYFLGKDYFYLSQLDLDQDNQMEWISQSAVNNELVIFQHDFKNAVLLKLPKDIEDTTVYYGTHKLNVEETLFNVQAGAFSYYYKYLKNPLYFFQYLIYSGIFLLMLLLVILIAKGQKIREANKRAIEKQISELLIKTVKNQVDPHFVFNAINIISEMTLMDNKLEADTFISQFSRFMRDTLKNSDKISTTLEEELLYTENFIKLQQTRFNHSFSYEFIMDKTINLKTHVPKHVLFCYVENAIKHGLSKTSNGLLKIMANKMEDHILLSIEDNGKGIEKTNIPKKNSTGNGLKIMDQIFELYSKLYKRKISHKFIELFDENHNKVGIRVEIKTSHSKKQKHGKF